MKLLKRGDDGLWRDENGTVWALPEESASVDKETRCGVGPLSLPLGTGECSSHDYAYSSPAYQANHTRKEADEMLRRQNPGLLGKIFYYLSRWFGGRFWENDRTR